MTCGDRFFLASGISEVSFLPLSEDRGSYCGKAGLMEMGDTLGKKQSTQLSFCKPWR